MNWRRNGPGVNQAITSLLDFDRNGVVSAGDALIARNNGGILLKLNLPGENELAAAPQVTAAAVTEFREAVIAPPTAVFADIALPAHPRTKVPSRGELLAYAMQSWHELLGANDDEPTLIGKSLVATKRQR